MTMIRNKPKWSHDIDNETMFYCSVAMWDLYREDPDLFGYDEREARRVALLAAEMFEQDHANTNWDEKSYTDNIWYHFRLIKKCIKCMGSSIQTVDELRISLSSSKRTYRVEAVEHRKYVYRVFATSEEEAIDMVSCDDAGEPIYDEHLHLYTEVVQADVGNDE